MYMYMYIIILWLGNYWQVKIQYPSINFKRVCTSYKKYIKRLLYSSYVCFSVPVVPSAAVLTISAVATTTGMLGKFICVLVMGCSFSGPSASIFTACHKNCDLYLVCCDNYECIDSSCHFHFVIWFGVLSVWELMTDGWIRQRGDLQTLACPLFTWCYSYTHTHRTLVSLFLLICFCSCAGFGGYRYRRRYYTIHTQPAATVVTTANTSEFLAIM